MNPYSDLPARVQDIEEADWYIAESKAIFTRMCLRIVNRRT